jgi:hypothetical protein
VATSLIASVAIGLAVDDTIHYLVRYNVEFKKDLDKDRAMRTTLTIVGRPIVFTSLTISAGFAVLLFSHFQPTATFGLLMIVTMASALVGDLILLPALMLHVELITAWDLLKMMPTEGGMSAEMVHELNQPLNAIKVGNDVIRMMAAKGKALSSSQVLYVTEEIRNQVNRAAQMIERFREINTLRGFNKRPVGINKPLEETLKVLDHQLQLDNITVETRFADDLPPIKAHYNRLVQVAFNVINNAREAIIAREQSVPSGHAGRIVLETCVKRGMVMFTIRDNGCGFDPRNPERAFEPFFTTKATGQGKGLGLTICRQIVRDCRGTISLSSLAPQGAEVLMRFPPIFED